MFNYTYATNKGLILQSAGATRTIIEREAMNHIAEMAGDVAGRPPPPDCNKELRNVFDAIALNNAEQAITAWTYYANTKLKQGISYHKIDEIKMVE